MVVVQGVRVVGRRRRSSALIVVLFGARALDSLLYGVRAFDAVNARRLRRC